MESLDKQMNMIINQKLEGNTEQTGTVQKSN